MNIVFMGSPDFAVPTLQEIHKKGHKIIAVYSQPPRPAGRGMDERKCPVHQAAEAMGLPVFTPKSLKSEEEQKIFADHKADAAIVVAYGLLLPKPVLETPSHGCFNLHGSLLPRWRGAAPIQRAIMAGDKQTAVQVMRMDEGLDTGDVCLSETIDISDSMTAGDLHDIMMEKGAYLVGKALDALGHNALTFSRQPEEGVTYAKKIDKSESRIDFSRPAEEVHNLIRGLSPFPGAWVEMTIRGKPQRVKILRSALSEGTGAPGTLLSSDMVIACASGAIRLIKLQRAGKSAMSAQDFQRGADLQLGCQIG